MQSQMSADEATKVLGLSFPFSKRQLVVAFRTKMKECHPDVNDEVDAHDMTIKVSFAYQVLQEYASTPDNGHDEPIEITDLDIKIAEAVEYFNAHLGVMDHSKTCSECDGHGKVRRSSYETMPCPDCLPLDPDLIRRHSLLNNLFGWMNMFSFYFGRRSSGFIRLDCKYCNGTGKHKIKCRACDGTGEFLTGSGKVVKCRNCNGTGVFKEVECNRCNGTGKWDRLVRCRRCMGSGVVDAPSNEMKLCPTCHGAKKIKFTPMNPVLIKGSVSGMSQKQRKKLQV